MKNRIIKSKSNLNKIREAKKIARYIHHKDELFHKQIEQKKTQEEKQDSSWWEHLVQLNKAENLARKKDYHKKVEIWR